MDNYLKRIKRVYKNEWYGGFAAEKLFWTLVFFVFKAGFARLKNKKHERPKEFFGGEAAVSLIIINPFNSF